MTVILIMDLTETNYDHTNANDVASRVAKEHPYAFHYHDKKFFIADENGVYSYPAEVDIFFLKLLTDDEKKYWERKLGKLKNELRIRYIRPENKNIITFNNGAFDMTTLSFRPYINGDFATITTNYNYKPADPIKKQWALNVLSSMFEGPEELKFVLKTLSQGLIGKKQIILFYDNCGKGLLITIIRATLHSHCGFLGSILDGDRRILISHEEDRATRFCRKYPQQATVIIDATKVHKRLDNCVAVRFPFRFVDDPKNPNERIINRNLKNEVKNYIHEFFEILVDYYKM